MHQLCIFDVYQHYRVSKFWFTEYWNAVSTLQYILSLQKEQDRIFILHNWEPIAGRRLYYHAGGSGIMAPKYTFLCVCLKSAFYDHTESQKCLGWKNPYRASHCIPPHPAKAWDTFHLMRLLRAPSILALVVFPVRKDKANRCRCSLW